jgi:hypothetical protein
VCLLLPRKLYSEGLYNKDFDAEIETIMWPLIVCLF